MKVPGQPLAERILSASAERSAPPQQVVLHGPAGSGKRRAARAYAWALVDPSRTHDPEEVSLDITTVSASGATIRLDDELEPALAGLAARPVVGERRVMIIEGAERLRPQEGAHRILKVLEEPPPRSHIILIADRIADLLPTVRSRCLPVPFRSPGWRLIADELERQGDPPDDARARARADGLLALQMVPFERRLRTLGADLGIAALSGETGGPELVHDIQKAMEAAASEHPSEELRRLRDEANALEGRRGGKTAAKKADEQERRERRRLVTDGWGHVLDGTNAVLADALSVAVGAEASVRHVELLDRLHDLAPPESRLMIERGLDEVQRTRVGLRLNPLADLWVEGMLAKLSMIRRGVEPPAVAAGRLGD